MANKNGALILGDENDIYQNLQDQITELKINQEAFKKIQENRHVEIRSDLSQISTLLLAISERLEAVELGKVDKEEGKGIVKVENLIGGDSQSVANIQSIKDYIDSLHALPRLSGEYSGRELKACNIALAPSNLLEIKLNKGSYLINGHLIYISNGDSRGKAYIEIDGSIHEKSTIVFGDNKLGIAPITALIMIDEDDTTVTLRAERTQGTDISIISNDSTRSYINYIKVD